MATQDAEIELIRNKVDCGAMLERVSPAWRLDPKGSTRRARKYRRGAGEILIVNHDGRGWWDPLSAAKGDIFDLVQFLDSSLNFGEVRRVLRGFVGVAPSTPNPHDPAGRRRPDRCLQERWTTRPRLRRGSCVWRYLTDQRRLTANVLGAADRADILREGPYGSAWFAYRDESGQVCHIDIRGPDFKGSLRGGRKTLFGLNVATAHATRLILAEAPIDALSLAVIEGLRTDTIYAATGGGMGPGTLQAIARTLTMIAAFPDALLASATDANIAGERFANRHAELAAAAGVAFQRLVPTTGNDWNSVLQQGRGPRLPGTRERD